MTISDLRLLLVDADGPTETAVVIDKVDLDALLTIAEEARTTHDGAACGCRNEKPCPTRRALDILEKD